ncbi:MAG: hypothetical protein ACK55Z_08200, partial [bacterium]
FSNYSNHSFQIRSGSQVVIDWHISSLKLYHLRPQELSIREVLLALRCVLFYLICSHHFSKFS